MNNSPQGHNGQATSPEINGNGKIPIIDDRLPSHSPEHERSTLGGLLIDPGLMAEVLTVLSADHFYSDRHNAIFRVMQDLHRDGKIWDVAIIATELGLRQQFDVVGGDDYLDQLRAANPAATAVIQHAAYVRDYADKRSMQVAADESARDSLSNQFTARQIHERGLARWLAIQTQGSNGRCRVSSRSDFATLADVRREASGDGWIWRGWVPSARLWGIAAFEGIGKTRFSMDLARRWWFGLGMPDGQPSTIPKNTPTLWVCADGQQDDLLEIAAAYKLPDEAVFLNTVPTDPYGGSSLDDLESIERLEAGIVAIGPACVFVDTLTNATSRDLCRANEAKLICSPLNEIAKRTKTAVCLDCHVALNGKALGKRVRGWTRTMISVECPDPNHPERLKIYAEKTFAKRPEPLGATMSDAGTEYDQNPPVAPDIPRGGKWGAPPKAREQAIDLIRESLTLENDQTGNELQETLVSRGVTKATFWRAAREMEANGELIIDGGAGTGRQAILHLIDTDPAF